MATIKAIIIEDEKKGMENLSLKLEKHCPGVEIIEKCFTGEKAVDIISKSKPDLIFLDIQLGTMTGFDVLNQLPDLHFEVIFTTAHDKYALRAIKTNALDYLLKPIKPNELKKAVTKARKVIQNSGTMSRIAVPISNGFQIIPINEIIYCKADNTYTNIYREKMTKPILVTRPLADIIKKLPLDKFARVHRTYAVNLDYVDFYKRQDGGYIILTNGAEVSVARNRREEFLKQLSANMK